ncbi:hypothetical protein ACJMK2_041716 [Sinanodonta woodiana]|uniref:J domain-containing protein n=1 Tax=Sinanodonta woodiana TaxID=1069815 RepID=A0ABD3W514_SINWO
MAEPRKQRTGFDVLNPLGQNDADFGQFITSATGSHDTFPPIDSWTQFSGMHVSSGRSHQQNLDQGSYTWDAFVTPPSSPSPDFGVGLPNYYSPFLGIESDLDSADSISFNGGIPGSFDIPVSSTSSLSSPLPRLGRTYNIPEPSPGLRSMSFANRSASFHEASIEGENMYDETLRKWNAFSSYNPFSTSELLTPTPKASVPEQQMPAYVSKPSYSDVAKTQKSKSTSSTTKDKDESVESLKSQKVDKSNHGQHRTVIKKVSSRPLSCRTTHNSSSDDMTSTTLSPDSKYGLDQFEDVRDEKSDGAEMSCNDGLPHLISKQSDGTTISSDTSGIEEIHLTKPLNNFADKKNEFDVGGERKNLLNSEKSRSGDSVREASKQSNSNAFFDPRRIFQSKETNRKGATNISESFSATTVLNNGKPASSCSASNAHRKTTDYINNDLRDSKKKVNQNNRDREVHSDSNAPKEAYNLQANDHRSDKPRGSVSSPQGTSASDETLTSSVSSDAGTKMSAKAHHMRLQQNGFDQEMIDEWLSFIYEKSKQVFHHIWTFMLMLILLLFSVIIYLVSGCVHVVSWLCSKVWHLVQTRVFKTKHFSDQQFWQNSSDTPRKLGLDENIVLPSTGEEAMQRLLACKGKDPYSILGLKASATDDDIKKYYRRQAVLVHPDKNQQPGAEEAFKILGHAFDLIGNLAKRQLYDRQMQEASEAEAAMREFNDLLTKLQEKIQEASNMMRCDNCGGKHKRIPVDRPWYNARFCDRCNIKHSAKEGDVWAETSMLGFLWHYYACMEGNVFDITEWVACKKDFFKHMQANAHHVFYRIATDGSRGVGHHGRSGEADLEDFISHLFHQAMHTDPNSQWSQQSSPSSGATWNQNASSAASAGASATNKRNRRRKKKH